MAGLDELKGLENAESVDGWELLSAAQMARIHGDFDVFIDLLAGARRIFLRDRELVGQSAVELNHGVAAMTSGNLEEAANRFDSAERLLQGTPEIRGLAHIWHARGDLARHERDENAAINAFSKAESLYSSIGDEAGQGNSAVSMAETYLQVGQIETARECSVKALQLHSASGHKHGLGSAHAIAGRVAYAGKHDSALTHLHQAQLLFDELNDINGSAGVSSVLAKIAQEKGNVKEAVREYEAAARGYQKINYQVPLQPVLLNLGRIQYDAGDIVSAKEAFLNLYTLRPPGYRHLAALGMGDCASLEGNQKDMTKWYDTYIGLLESQEDRRYVPQALHYVGTQWSNAKSPGKASGYLYKAASGFLEQRQIEPAAITFVDSAQLSLQAMDRQRGREIYSAASVLLTAIGNHGAAAEVEICLSQIAVEDERWDHASGHLTNAEISASKVDDPVLAAEIQLQQGELCKWLGDLQKALEAVERALLMFREARDRKGEAQANHSASVLRHITGNNQLALKHAVLALGMFQELGTPIGIGNACLTLSEIYDVLGDDGRSIAHLSRAHESFQNAKDLPGLAQATNKLARIARRRGEENLAIDLFAQATKLFKVLDDRMGEANVLRGQAETTVRDDAVKEELLRRALQLYESVNHYLGIAHCNRELALISAAAERHDEASASFSKAEAAAKIVKSKHLDIQMSSAKAVLHHEDTEVAIGLHLKVLDLLESEMRYDGLWYTGLILSGLIFRQGRVQDSLDVLRRVLIASRSVGRWIGTAPSRRKMHREFSRLQNRALELCHMLDAPEMAGEIIELGAAALLPGLQFLLNEPLPEEAQHDARVAVEGVQAMVHMLVQLETKKWDSFESDAKFTGEVRGEARDVLIDSIASTVGEEIRALIDPDPIDYQEVLMSLLRPGTLIVQLTCPRELAPGADIYAVWAESGSEPKLQKSSLSAASARVARKLSHLSDQQPRMPTGSSSSTELEMIAELEMLAETDEIFEMLDKGNDVEGFGELVTQLLPSDLLNRLTDLCHQSADGEVPRLLIIPDTELWNLPWSALPIRTTTATAGDSHLADLRLIDIAAVSVCASLSSIKAAEPEPVMKPATSNRGALAWLADVDDIEMESAALRETFGENLRVAESPEEFVSALQHVETNTEAVVVSVHGQAEGGFAHGLQLDKDVHLTAGHLLGRKMPPTLVIGACWTAYIDPDPARDQIALTTLAIAQGANDVIGGIYPLPDSAVNYKTNELLSNVSPTAEILSEVYRNLKELTPAIALRRAQMCKRTLPSHCWGGFIHVAGAI